MIRTLFALIISSILSFNCNHVSNNPGKVSDTSLHSNYRIPQLIESEQLIKHVRLAINQKFNHWILFSNGTYIIIEDTTVEDDSTYCIKIMKEYGPVRAGGQAGDFGVTKLNRTEGWVVSGHYYGMYTYVHPSELDSLGVKNPTDLDIGLVGRKKRDMDGTDCKIIHVNK